MTQQPTVAPISPDVISRQMDAAMQAMGVAQSRSDAASQLAKLEAKQAQLEVKVGDLVARKNLLQEQRGRLSGDERTKLDKPWLDVQHDLNAATSELQVTRSQLERVKNATEPVVWTADAPLAKEPTIATTVAPPPDPFDQAQIRGIEVGAFVLMIPLVLAFSRRIWVRSGPRVASVDLESSPRLQRMEQAIESIALEVERIGEGQRFTTKLLAERDPVASRIAPGASPARREPGTITPH